MQLLRSVKTATCHSDELYTTLARSAAAHSHHNCETIFLSEAIKLVPFLDHNAHNSIFRRAMHPSKSNRHPPPLLLLRYPNKKSVTFSCCLRKQTSRFCGAAVPHRSPPRQLLTDSFRKHLMPTTLAAARRLSISGCLGDLGSLTSLPPFVKATSSLRSGL